MQPTTQSVNEPIVDFEPTNLRVLFTAKMIQPLSVQVSERLCQLKDHYGAAFKPIAMSGYYTPTSAHDLPRHLMNLVLTYGVEIYVEALEIVNCESMRKHAVKRIEAFSQLEI